MASSWHDHCGGDMGVNRVRQCFGSEVVAGAEASSSRRSQAIAAPADPNPAKPIGVVIGVDVATVSIVLEIIIIIRGYPIFLLLDIAMDSVILTYIGIIQRCRCSWFRTHIGIGSKIRWRRRMDDFIKDSPSAISLILRLEQCPLPQHKEVTQYHQDENTQISQPGLNYMPVFPNDYARYGIHEYDARGIEGDEFGLNDGGGLDDLAYIVRHYGTTQDFEDDGNDESHTVWTADHHFRYRQVDGKGSRSSHEQNGEFGRFPPLELAAPSASTCTALDTKTHTQRTSPQG
eukprot:CAMPEP_0178666074 /NCGR_PEP_ID=MMETSP0698-20121128/30296_1 /TAXON_ID=265572 /ORGANISM="Extubocellulus spinifer, Strain CCMP396" /LENGTH=288 /DNA_ID=CAMNT_0020309437 /DNA_START=329 /DNA_END=1197 /DNA_ORIENTATION=+